jgi:hypothetical protein
LEKNVNDVMRKIFGGELLPAKRKGENKRAKNEKKDGSG